MSDQPISRPSGMYRQLREASIFLQRVASAGGPLSGNAMEMARRCIVEADLYAAASDKQDPITDNDRRWRFLEHGCQWVSFTPIGGDTRSFDPRVVTDSPGVGVVAMRVCVDRWTEKHLAILKEGINAAKR